MTMYARFVQCSDVTVCIAPYTRTVKRERYRAVSQHREFAFERRKCSALLHPGRQNTDCLQAVIRGQPDVVGARVAGSDAQTGAASYLAVVSGTPSNSTLHLVVVEELGRPAAWRSLEPGGNSRDNPVADHNWCAETAIKEHGIGSSHSLVCRPTVHGLSGLGQKCSKVRGDGRIAGIGQAEFAQSCWRASCRHIMTCGDWQEAVRQNLQDFVAG